MEFNQLLKMTIKEKRKLLSDISPKVKQEHFEEMEEKTYKKIRNIAIDFVLFSLSKIKKFYGEKSIKTIIIFMNVFFEEEESFLKYNLDKNEKNLIKFIKIFKEMDGCMAYIFAIYMMEYLEEHYLDESEEELTKVQFCRRVNVAYCEKRIEFISGKVDYIEKGITRVKLLNMQRQLDELMIGQQAYKATLLNIIRCKIRGEKTSVTLVIGDTGTGKDYAIQSVKEILKKNDIRMPIINFPLSSLTQSGFSGASLTDIIKEYKREKMLMGNDTEGIIVLGECDKKIIPSYSSKEENVNYSIQGELLRFIEGMEVDGVDTSKVTFVLSGSFEALSDIIASEKKKKIGFEIDENIIGDNKLTEYQNALLEYGMRSELLGRINQIVVLNNYTKEELKEIVYSKYGKIEKLRKKLSNDGVELIIDNVAVDMIVDKVFAQNLGVRSIENEILNIIPESIQYMAYVNGCSKMIINKKALIEKKPQMIYERRK